MIKLPNNMGDRVKCDVAGTSFVDCRVIAIDFYQFIVTNSNISKNTFMTEGSDGNLQYHVEGCYEHTREAFWQAMQKEKRK